jgi:hypothetical protein
MAHYEDFDGVYFTLESLALHQNLKDCEIIVVDNSPGSEHSKHLRSFLGKWMRAQNSVTVRYIPMPESTGTTQPRERIFREATGDLVLVMDCHVMFPVGVIDLLRAYFEVYPDSKDIVSGPLVYDDVALVADLRKVLPTNSFETQFDPVWRSAMWGTWGCDNRAADAQNPPFEIPGQGLGVFACLKKSWVGFNPYFRGFGGEELYIHEKFRQAGGRALCLPFLRWIHRFGRVGGNKYPALLYDKVRNYVLGHQELGLPLDDIYDHFVNQDISDEDLPKHLVEVHSVSLELIRRSPDKLRQIHSGFKLPKDQWEYLLDNPIKHFRPASALQLRNLQGSQPPPQLTDIAALFEWGKAGKRDLDEHFDTLREFASKCNRVTEFTKKRESTIAFAAGKPLKLVSYTKEPDLVLRKVIEALPQGSVEIYADTDSLSVPIIDETDLLYLDTVHSGERLKAELSLHGGQVRRFIVIRGTGSNGNVGEGGNSPGLFEGIKWYLNQNPKAFVAYHAEHKWGITVIGLQEVDRPASPVNIFPPGKGPGTELTNMLKEIGVAEKPGCDCKAKAEEMDKLGCDGCEQQFERIVKQIKAGQDRWSWSEKIKAAALSVKTGLAWKLNPTDPIPGLVKEAIRRAREKEKVS